MKVLFIKAKSKGNVLNVIKNIKLPKKVGLVSTIQFIDQLNKVKKYLEKKGIKVSVAGQVLGCNVRNAIKIKDKINAFLYVGSGEFHPIEIARKTKKEVIIANPISKEVSRVDKQEVLNYEKRLKGEYLKFLSSKKIGILVSLKPGQGDLNSAIKLKNKLKRESYIFIGDEINPNELENFRDIDLWINTACPRVESKNIINTSDLQKMNDKV